MRTMGDVGASALLYVSGLLSTLASRVNTADIAAVLAIFVILLVARLALPTLAAWAHKRAVSAANDRFESLFDLYAGRFRVRGFRHQTCRYSLWLAFALWLHVFVILTFWPTWVGLAILALSALAAALTMSVLGYKTRGPQGTLRRFGIFYEPSFALVSMLLMGKLSDVANRVFGKLAALLL
jgi:hypothetical protein